MSTHDSSANKISAAADPAAISVANPSVTSAATATVSSVPSLPSAPANVPSSAPPVVSSNPVQSILVKIDETVASSENPFVKKLTQNEHLRYLHSKVFGTFNGAANGTSSDSPVALDAAVTTVTDPNAYSGIFSPITDWVSRHKFLATMLAAAAAGGTLYYLYKLNVGDISGPDFLRVYRKRLAKKAPNGGRFQVVVIAGSPTEPLTRSIAADLSRRGFIIYWTTTSEEEEGLVLAQNSDDIRPLPIRSHDIRSVRKSIKALANVLNVPAAAFPGAVPHMLTLAGVIVIPDLYYPSGPVECIRLDTWSDLLNSKLLGPVFLLSNGLLDLVRSHQSRVLLVSPSIMGSLNPGYNAAEGMVTSALQSLAQSISRELAPQGIPFVHVRMGTFNLSAGAIQHERQVQNAVRADILTWPENLRSLYSRPYQALSELTTRARKMGSSIRILHHTIFDALMARHPSRVYYAGKGAFLYHFLPKYLPEDFVSYLLHPPAPPAPRALEKGWEPL